VGISIVSKQVTLPQVFSPKANVVGVTLSFLPTRAELKKGEQATFDLLLNPAGNQVSSVELKLQFDSSIIEVSDITPTTLLPQTSSKDLTKPGQASVILITNPGGVNQGEQSAARITVKALTEGSTKLGFDPGTKVSAEGKIGDVLGGVESAVITVTNTTANPPILAFPSAPLPKNTQADELIKEYLNSSSEAEVKEKTGLFGSYKNIVSEYIKNTINSINNAAEKEVRKFLD
jgi:hypothetical protein